MFLTRRSRNALSLFAVVLVGLLVVPGNAHALTLEYYTYGGFADAVSGFKKVALICSDNLYMTVAAVVWIGAYTLRLGMVHITLLVSAGREKDGLHTDTGNTYTVTMHAFIGAVFFFGLFLPKGDLQITDANTGKTQLVGGLPLVGVISVGATSLAERSILQIVETAGDPLPFSKQSGMKSMAVINAIMTRSDSRPRGALYIGSTFNSYLADCVPLAMALPATGLTADEIVFTSTDFMATLEKAASPSNYTTIFDAAAPQGAGGTCANSFLTFKTIAAPLTVFKDTIKQACADAGYKVFDTANGAAEYTACQDSTDNLLGAIAPGWDLGSFATRAYWNNLAYFSLIKTMPSVVVTKNTSAYNKTTFFTYFRSLDQKRGLITAYGALMLPFFGLLILSGRWFKALAGVVSIFLGMAVWSVLGALVSDFFLSSAVETWAKILENGYGLNNVDFWGANLMEKMDMWGVYSAATFGIAMSAAKMFSVGASVMGSAGAVNTSAQEGRLEMGKAGTAALAAGAVATGAGSSAAMAGVKTQSSDLMQASRQTDQWGAGQKAGAGLSGVASADSAIVAASGPSAVATTSGQNTTGDWNRSVGKGVADADIGAKGLANTADTKVRTEAAAGQATADMVKEQAAKSGNDMSTPELRKQAYGEVAGLAVAQSKATLNAFSDKDANGQTIAGSGARNYQDFLEQNQGKAIGALQGEQKAFEAAKGAGFSGNWKDYHSLQSEMSSKKGFTDAASLKNLSNEKYGGDDMRMFADMAAVRNAQAHGNASGVLAEARNAAVGAASQSLAASGVDKKSANDAMVAYSSGGANGMRESLAKSDWGQKNPDKVDGVAASARDAAVKQGVFEIAKTGGAVDQAKKEGVADVAGNPETLKDVREGAGNEVRKNLGTNVDAVRTATEGSGLDARQVAGLVGGVQSIDGIAGARMQMMASQTLLGGSDPRSMMTQMSMKNGAMSGVLNAKGAAALSAKMGQKGLFKAGDQVSYGMQQDGSVKFANAQVGGFRMSRNGQTVERLANTKVDTGSINNSVVQNSSGSVTSAGNFVNTVDSQGTQTQGVVTIDRNGKSTLTNGTVSQVTTKTGVETLRDANGEAVDTAVVTRTGDKTGGSVKVTADSSQKYDGSKTAVTGTANTSVQTLSAVADDGSLTGGKVATGIAVGERSVAVAAEKAAQVGGILGGVRKIASPNGALNRQVARDESAAARAAGTPTPAVTPPTPGALPRAAAPAPSSSTQSMNNTRYATPAPKPAAAKPAATPAAAAKPVATPAVMAAAPVAASMAASGAHASTPPAPQQVVVENTTQVESRRGGGGVQMPNYVAPDLQPGRGRSTSNGGGTDKSKPRSAPSVDGSSSSRSGKSGPPKID